MIFIKCSYCGKNKDIWPYQFRKNKNNFCNSFCYGKWQSHNKINKNNSNWKGENASYSAKHIWIKNQSGKACNYPCAQADNTCKGQKHWANISGKYLRDLSDWWVLCHSHHMRYDMTDEWREKARRNALNMSKETKKKIGLASKRKWSNPEYRKKMSFLHLGNKLSEETKQKISLFQKGRRRSKETRQKMSEARKKYLAIKKLKEQTWIITKQLKQ